jgi:hypothetical protein
MHGFTDQEKECVECRTERSRLRRNGSLPRIRVRVVCDGMVLTFERKNTHVDFLHMCDANRVKSYKSCHYRINHW